MGLDEHGVLRGAQRKPAAAQEEPDLFGEFEVLERMDAWAAEGRSWESVRGELAEMLGLPPFETIVPPDEDPPWRMAAP